VAHDRAWDPFTRLACQTNVTGPITLQRLIRMGSEVTSLDVEALTTSGGVEMPLAILFCDIRDFTPFVERHFAYDVVHMLNNFFTELGEAILLNNGVIYQYVGDELTGLFGVGGSSPQASCLHAIRAGLGMLEALTRFNATLADAFGTTFRIGIGAHFGPTVVGHIGHPSHKQFAVIGDAVNIASRIQSTNKTLGTTFLASEALFAHLPEGIVAGHPIQTHLRGKRGLFHLIEVHGFVAADPILLVQETSGWLMHQQEAFAEALYQHLFALAPEVQSLFRGDMQKQGQMVTHMLQSLIYTLSRPDHLSLGLQDLGRRHVAHGVLPHHYEVFRRAFLDALGVVLGNRMTPPAKAAWASTLDIIIDHMQAV